MNIIPSIIEYAVENKEAREAVLYGDWNTLYNKLERVLSNIIVPECIGQDELTESVVNIDIQEIIDVMATESEGWLRKSISSELNYIDLAYYTLVFDWLCIHHDCKITREENTVMIEFDGAQAVRNFENADDAEFIIQRYNKLILKEIEESLSGCSSKQLRKIQKIINA